MRSSLFLIDHLRLISHQLLQVNQVNQEVLALRNVSQNLRDIHFAIDSLVAGKTTKSEVNIGLHLTWNDEIENITNRIKSLVVNREVKPEQIAVLSRNGKELLAIYDLLISK